MTEILKYIKAFLLLYTLLLSTTFNCSAGEGLNIKVAIKPSGSKTLYLSRYFGDGYPVIDSAYLNFNNEFIFQNSQPANEGIYMLRDENKYGICDFLIDSNQHFSISVDQTNPLKPIVTFTNSKPNEQYQKLIEFTERKANEYDSLKNLKSTTGNFADTIRINGEMQNITRQIREYRLKLIKNYEGSLIAKFIQLMLRPELPDELKNPANTKDSLAGKQFLKDHFWDGTDFWDERLAYTPFLSPKLDYYFTEILDHNEDTIIAKIDWIMQSAVASDAMTEVFLKKMIFGSLYHRFKWGDEVLIHLYEKYIATKSYDWLSGESLDKISEKVYFTMGKVVGTPAPEITLPSPDKKEISLSDVKGNYTLVCFWDPTCSHCRETLPKIDSLYRYNWKEKGVKILAVASESDGTEKDWLDYIQQNHLEEWNNVYYSKETERDQMLSGKKSYSQLYDVWFNPTFFLLDKDKKFVAKKLPYKNLVELMNKLTGK